jgi:hypothetical protein
MKRLAFALALVAYLGGGTSAVRADMLIFSNLGAGDSYQQNSGWTESGTQSSPGPNFSADSFLVGPKDVNFTQARLALSFVSGDNPGARDVTLYLVADKGGVPDYPNGIVEELAGAGLPDFGAYGQGHLMVFTSSSNPLLSAGHRYWLLPQVDAGTWGAWNFNNTKFKGSHAYSTDEENWTISTDYQGAFDVRGTATPEPGGLVLAATAITLLAAAGLCRRFRQGVAWA